MKYFYKKTKNSDYNHSSKLSYRACIIIFLNKNDILKIEVKLWI